MAVSIRPNFTARDIARLIQVRKKRIEDVIILNLMRIGEEFVTLARDTNTYKDRTGNLRSSIGYIVLKNGAEVAQNFKQATGGARVNRKGVGAAKDLIAEARKKFPTGYVLIGVAGMQYAAAVESKGFDVITGASQQAESMLRAAIIRIKNKTAA